MGGCCVPSIEINTTVPVVSSPAYNGKDSLSDTEIMAHILSVTLTFVIIYQYNIPGGNG